MSKTRPVKDLMNPDIMTVADDMTTNELARYLIEREISGAPVVDSEGHLIGVVSMTDIGRNMAEPSDDESSRGSSFYGDIAADLTLEDLGQRYVEERVVTVRDVMTPVIHNVPVTASVAGGTYDGRSAHSPVDRDSGEGACGHHHELGLVESRRWRATNPAATGG
jgi:CBS domain-containing protein